MKESCLLDFSLKSNENLTPISIFKLLSAKRSMEKTQANHEHMDTNGSMVKSTAKFPADIIDDEDFENIKKNKDILEDIRIELENSQYVTRTDKAQLSHYLSMCLI